MKKSIKKLIAVALSAVMALTGSLAGITGAGLSGGESDEGVLRLMQVMHRRLQ